MALLEAFARPLDERNPAAAHAELLNERYAHWRTRDVLDDVIHHEFSGEIALVSSFGAESVVLLHLAASSRSGRSRSSSSTAEKCSARRTATAMRSSRCSG